MTALEWRQRGVTFAGFLLGLLLATSVGINVWQHGEIARLADELETAEVLEESASEAWHDCAIERGYELEYHRDASMARTIREEMGAVLRDFECNRPPFNLYECLPPNGSRTKGSADATE